MKPVMGSFSRLAAQNEVRSWSYGMEIVDLLVGERDEFPGAAQYSARQSQSSFMPELCVIIWPFMTGWDQSMCLVGCPPCELLTLMCVHWQGVLRKRDWCCA